MIAAQRPWVVYTRVSSDRQVEEGCSLPEQRATCLAWLKAYGREPAEVVEDDGYSAGSLNRPGIQALIARVRRGEIAGIVVKKLNRLTRSLRDQLDLVDLFKQHRTAFACLDLNVDTESPNGRTVLNIIGSVSQGMREDLAKSIKDALAYLRAKGCHLGGAPTGTERYRDEHNEPRLRPHPEHAPIVIAMWELAARGATLAELASHLNREGLRTRRGSLWGKSSVQHLLHATSVIGVLVDQRTFTAAQTSLTQRSRRGQSAIRRGGPPPRNPAARGTWSLARLCWCGQCGSAMVIAQSRGRGGVPYHYLRCAGRLQKGREHCSAGDMPHDAIEQALIDALRARAASGELAGAFAAWLVQRRASITAASSELPVLRKKRDKLGRQRDRILDLIQDGDAVARAAQERLGDIQVQLETIAGQIAGLEAAGRAQEADEVAIERLTAAVAAGLERLPDATPEERAVVISGMVERVTLTRESMEVELAALAVGTARPARKVLPTVRPAVPGPRFRSRLRWVRRYRKGMLALAT